MGNVLSNFGQENVPFYLCFGILRGIHVTVRVYTCNDEAHPTGAPDKIQ